MATTKRDYYEVLGVPKTVTPDELKKAYRKLAMEFHPDRNQGDPGAEVRFKEVGEAYSVLSDPEKKHRYDQFGHASDGMPGMGGFSFDSAFDLFDMFFGGQRRARSGPQRGADLRMNIEISFHDAVYGVTRAIEVPRAGTCEACSGSGAKAGTVAVQCPDCQGQGHTRRVVNSLFGQMAQAVPCGRCSGIGTTVDEPCVECRGQGLVDIRKSLEVTVPPGVDEDVQVRMAGEGEPGPRGGPSGDLFLGFRIKAHEHLVRRGTDLLYELPVSVSQAVLGDMITVPTVDGEHQIVVPMGTQHGKVIKISGFGVPHLRSGRRGDQLCVVKVVIPTKLDADERALYEQLSGRDGKPEPVKRGFFDQLKDAFRG